MSALRASLFTALLVAATATAHAQEDEATTATTHAQEDEVDARPVFYTRHGSGVLGHVVVGGDGAFAVDVSSTGVLGIAFPVTAYLALGAQLRGSIVRGGPIAESYLGDISLVTRWSTHIARGRVRVDFATLAGPSVALMYLARGGSPMSTSAMADHGVLGLHVGAATGVIVPVAHDVAVEINTGYVHHVLFSPPRDAGPDANVTLAPVVHVDQLFIEGGLVFAF